MNKAEKGALFFLLLAVGCGKVVTPPVPPPITPPANLRTTLLLFSAGFCKVCKQVLPEIDAGLKDKPNLTTRLWLVAGDPANVHPTEAMALEYGKHYAPSALAMPDAWRWIMFKNMVGSNLEVPAAVVLGEDGNIIKKFLATGFSSIDVVDYVGKR